MKLVLGLVAALFSLGTAQAGWDHGNAGDTFAAEFILTAKDLHARLKLLPSSELQRVNLAQLAGAIATVNVSSEEKVVLRGREVDALNDPDKGIIVVSRTRWRQLRTAAETTNRLMVVLHEYLFHVGVDDTNFSLSGRLVPQLAVKDFNPGRWWNPLNPVNRITTNLVYNIGACSLPAIELDTEKTDETVEVSATGHCVDDFVRVVVRKSGLQAPPSSQARGIFHRYEITVFNHRDDVVGLVTYEPEWGQCLLPQDGACSLSGKIFTGGVEFKFWMQR